MREPEKSEVSVKHIKSGGYLSWVFLETHQYHFHGFMFRKQIVDKEDQS